MGAADGMDLLLDLPYHIDSPKVRADEVGEVGSGWLSVLSRAKSRELR